MNLISFLTGYNPVCTNFRFTGETESTPSFPSGAHYATVDITAGLLFWRRTTTVEVARSKTCTFWLRLDNSHSCPGFQVERLELVERLKADRLRARDPFAAAS